MDFDKPKVYGDTFISDGLVFLVVNDGYWILEKTSTYKHMYLWAFRVRKSLRPLQLVGLTHSTPCKQQLVNS